MVSVKLFKWSHASFGEVSCNLRLIGTINFYLFQLPIQCQVMLKSGKINKRGISRWERTNTLLSSSDFQMSSLAHVLMYFSM